MARTIGQGEDDAAFHAMLEEARAELERGYKESKEEFGLTDKRTARLRIIPLYMLLIQGALRYVFDAGMKRGEGKRGCCEADERDG